MGHVMRDNLEGEVQITLLAAGMEPGAPMPTPRQDKEVFYGSTPSPSFGGSQSAPVSEAKAAPPNIPTPIQLDEIDLDIPTFLRRQRLGG